MCLSSKKTRIKLTHPDKRKDRQQTTLGGCTVFGKKNQYRIYQYTTSEGFMCKGDGKLSLFNIHTNMDENGTDIYSTVRSTEQI